ncbi:hypothetical protein GW7_05992 [Heterocephalus glaber]|uniref:Uncharacterized protein n=1 Tax=Heterocephalus glaber TaxID=10181 RepID=G5ANT0_HETGA|nr:hypothetical protein GW7_05992 [Heterocephalus glaber]
MDMAFCLLSNLMSLYQRPTVTEAQGQSVKHCESHMGSEAIAPCRFLCKHQYNATSSLARKGNGVENTGEYSKHIVSIYSAQPRKVQEKILRTNIPDPPSGSPHPVLPRSRTLTAKPHPEEGDPDSRSYGDPQPPTP